MIEVRPLPRGEGFAFEDKITGGVVPRQYIPSVEAGVRDYIKRGPLGFPVVDLAVRSPTAPTTPSIPPTPPSSRRRSSPWRRRCRRPSRCCSSRSSRSRSPSRRRRCRRRAGLVDGAARADPRLRRAPGLAGLGRAQRHDPGIGDRRPHRRAALRDRRRRLLLDEVRPHGRARRPPGRDGARRRRRRRRRISSLDLSRKPRAGLEPLAAFLRWPRASARAGPRKPRDPASVSAR